MDIMPLFPIPIGMTKISTPRMSEVIASSDALSYLEKSDVWDCSVETSFSNEGRKSSPDFARIQEAVQQVLLPPIVEYLSACHDQLCSDENVSLEFDTTDCWLNRYVGDHFQERHTHSASIVSYIYMYKTTEAHSFLRFHNDREFISDDIHLRSGVRYEQASTSFLLEEQSLLIFPSYLAHSVAPNRNAPVQRGERITFSGNILARRAL